MANEGNQQTSSSELSKGWIFGLVLLIFGVLIGGFYLDFIGIGGQQSNPRGRYLFIVVLSSFFPISALAYQIFQREKLLVSLQADFKMLGLGKGDGFSLTNGLNKRYTLCHNPWNFIVQSILPTLLTIFGASFLLFHPESSFALQELLAPTAEIQIQALRYGFLGAYIFSLQLIYRRYTTLDLQPTIYMGCAITLIAGFAFNYTAFQAIAQLISKSPTSSPTTIETGLVAIVAFSLGYFPGLAIRWFNQIAYTALGSKQRHADRLPLSLIDGISQFHEARLRDEGIDNLQNLASVKIDELLLNTRFNAQQVLEWIDQAILFLYVGPSNIDSFHRGGVRGISDFHDLWQAYHIELKRDNRRGSEVPELSEKLQQARQSRALQFQSTPEYLDVLYVATKEGPNMAYIENYWGNLKKYIQRKQTDAMRKAEQEAKKEVKSVISKAQIAIFREISKRELYDETRYALGRIAETLIPNANEIALDEETRSKPEALVGLAWWLWWLTNREDIEGNYSQQVTQHYEDAIKEAPQDPNIRYEAAQFYTNQTKDYERAREHAEQAVQLSKNEEEKIPCLVMLTKIHMENHDQDAAKTSANDAIQIMDASINNMTQKENLEKVQNISETLQETLKNHRRSPKEITTLLSKIEEILSTNHDNGTRPVQEPVPLENKS